MSGDATDNVIGANVCLSSMCFFSHSVFVVFSMTSSLYDAFGTPKLTVL
jgi:hypothetical protein